MNIPFLIVALPVLYGIPAYWLYRSRPQATSLGAAGVLLALSWMAAGIPFDQPFLILGISIPVSHSFSFLGRQFDFLPFLRPALLFVFGIGTLFMLATLVVRTTPAFFPASLTFLSLMGAALLIQPFLYAAIFLFLAVALFSVSFPRPSGTITRGFSRLIVFTALAIPFLLLAGTELSIQAGLPPDPALIRTLVVLLGFGFALILGFPPFHFWQADLSESDDSLPVAFLLALFSGSAFFFLVRFPGEFDWLRNSALPFDLLRGGGLFLCGFGAILGLLQEKFGRMMSYLSMINLGVSLLMLSAFSADTLVLSFSLLVVRAISFLAWGLANSVIRNEIHRDISADLRGIFSSQPLASSTLVLSGLALVGFPGLLAFPAYWAALRSFSSGYFPTEAHFYIIIVAASLTTGIYSVLRFAQTMFRLPAGPTPRYEAGRLANLFLIASLAVLLLLGLFPQLLYPIFSEARILFPATAGLP